MVNIRGAACWFVFCVFFGLESAFIFIILFKTSTEELKLWQNKRLKASNMWTLNHKRSPSGYQKLEVHKAVSKGEAMQHEDAFMDILMGVLLKACFIFTSLNTVKGAIWEKLILLWTKLTSRVESDITAPSVNGHCWSKCMLTLTLFDFWRYHDELLGINLETPVEAVL